MDKQKLRELFKQKRVHIDTEQISKILADRLKQLEHYRSAKNILIFYPIKWEINLLELLDDKTKKFYLPKIEKDNLMCCPYKRGDDLCISCFKTQEPLTLPIDKNLIDLVVVPALCCDKQNYRLGYGGGFYDRFLNDYRGFSVVCIPKEFVIDSIYPEKYDIPVDLVITD